MIARRHGDDVAGKGIDLQQQRTHHALDLPGFVKVAALLSHRIEFIEEQNAMARAGVLEHLSNPLRSLTEVAADDGLIPNHK